MLSTGGTSVSFLRPAPVFIAEERPLSTKKVDKALVILQSGKHTEMVVMTKC